MAKVKGVRVDWTRKETKLDIGPALIQFKRYLRNEGYRETTVDCYTFFAKGYLKFAKTDKPTVEDALRYREYLISLNRKRSTINNNCFALRHFHKMQGQKVNFIILKNNNQIPYYFDEEDILKVLSACNNLKHYTTLLTLFYGCLRASELCALTDEDLDLKSLTIRVQGKGGKEALIPIQADCAEVLKEYLRIRPQIEINKRHPLFYTQFGDFWERKSLYRMFIRYKEKAGVKKPGGLHVWGRHSAASILVKNGCDLLTIKELLRHTDIKTTERYLHLSDQTKREKYERYLKLAD